MGTQMVQDTLQKRLYGSTFFQDMLQIQKVLHLNLFHSLDVYHGRSMNLVIWTYVLLLTKTFPTLLQNQLQHLHGQATRTYPIYSKSYVFWEELFSIEIEISLRIGIHH